MKKIFLITGLVVALIINANGTNWFSKEHVCPVCHEKCTFQEIATYGAYIFTWPSKYQYVFWPFTDFRSVYCCPRCHFSTFLWDFDNIPDDKVGEIRTYLSGVKLEKKFWNYQDVPIITRLDIARHVYTILGRDKEFWCRFYRILGYHYDHEKNASEAREARTVSMNLARQMIADTAYRGREKENYVIMAAMSLYLDKKDSTLVYLEKASDYVYSNREWKEKNSRGLDEYLTELIDQYKTLIRSGGSTDE